MKVLWLTDLHLNFLPPLGVERLLEDVHSRRPEAVLITGDFSESNDLLRFLAQIDRALDVPVYFVLGNHDFYFSSIEETRNTVSEFCRESGNLVYLTTGGVRRLARNVALVGHDGWADARLGDYVRSYVMMHDYRLIEDLKPLGKEPRWAKLKQLGDEAAAHVRRVLPRALERNEEAFLITHVPPLREACWHQGEISDDEWAPHFTCKAMGDAILEIMQERPDRRLTVLCGHTHGEGECRPLENVVIYTGGAEYGHPSITGEFEL